MFTGEFYILNALWIGAVLCIAGFMVKPVARVLIWIILIFCPYGVILLYDFYIGIRRGMVAHKAEQENHNVTKF